LGFLPQCVWDALELPLQVWLEALVIVLVSQLDARQQAILSVRADAFVGKGEISECVAEGPA